MDVQYTTKWSGSSDYVKDVITTGMGEVRLYTARGEAVLVNDTYGNVSEAYLITQYASQARCTEIGDLVYCRYTHQGSYFLARLSGRIKIRVLHLPQPLSEKESAIAARLEQEAALHGIRVLYDAEEMLAIYDTVPARTSEGSMSGGIP